MTDSTGLNDVAAAWVEALLARGVSLQLRGKRLAYHPKTAYGELSHGERATLRRHKAVIIAVVRERDGGTARATVVPHTSVASKPVEPQPPCPYCYASPYVGRDHPAFFDLHPIETLQRADDERLTAEIRTRVGKPHP